MKDEVVSSGCTCEEALYAPLLHVLADRMMLYRDKDLHQELIQAGYIGLLLAKKRYDPSRAVQFTTYAIPWVLGEMRTALRNALDNDRSYRIKKRADHAETRLYQALGRQPTISEIAKEAGLDAHDLLALSSAYSHFLCPDDTSGHSAPDDIWSSDRDDQRIDIREALFRLAPEERQVILLRYYREITQAETSRLLGRSQSWTSKTESRALDKLRLMLGGHEPTAQRAKH